MNLMRCRMKGPFFSLFSPTGRIELQLFSLNANTLRRGKTDTNGEISFPLVSCAEALSYLLNRYVTCGLVPKWFLRWHTLQLLTALGLFCRARGR